MSNVVHRTTREYRRSVNTALYPPIDWIINPDLSNVIGFENQSKYWIITGDVVTLMSPAERDALDVVDRDNNRDRIIGRLDNVENFDRALVRILMREINILRGQAGLPDRTFNQFRQSIRDEFGL